LVPGQQLLDEKIQIDQEIAEHNDKPFDQTHDLKVIENNNNQSFGMISVMASDEHSKVTNSNFETAIAKSTAVDQFKEAKSIAVTAVEDLDAAFQSSARVYQGCDDHLLKLLAGMNFDDSNDAKVSNAMTDCDNIAAQTKKQFDGRVGGIKTKTTAQSTGLVSTARDATDAVVLVFRSEHTEKLAAKANEVREVLKLHKEAAIVESFNKNLHEDDRHKFESNMLNEKNQKLDFSIKAETARNLIDHTKNMADQTLATTKQVDTEANFKSVAERQAATATAAQTLAAKERSDAELNSSSVAVRQATTATAAQTLAAKERSDAELNSKSVAERNATTATAAQTLAAQQQTDAQTLATQKQTEVDRNAASVAVRNATTAKAEHALAAQQQTDAQTLATQKQTEVDRNAASVAAQAAKTLLARQTAESAEKVRVQAEAKARQDQQVAKAKADQEKEVAKAKADQDRDTARETADQDKTTAREKAAQDKETAREEADRKKQADRDLKEFNSFMKEQEKLKAEYATAAAKRCSDMDADSKLREALVRAQDAYMTHLNEVHAQVSDMSVYNISLDPPRISGDKIVGGAPGWSWTQ